jgi:hypothetical protein
MTKQKVTIRGHEIKIIPNERFGEVMACGTLNELLLALDESEPEWDARKLKVGDIYWFIAAAGGRWRAFWEPGEACEYMLKTNNVYPTYEAAQKAYEEIMNKEI